ncbi:MAG TPA: hypothetical protein VHP14_06610 [Anaerolineales bacterium]|nr:hypothetical protein [Anaerolineales bacterium]
MGKKKIKLTETQKAEKKRRREEYMTIFIRGKQKRIRRAPAFDGMDVDEFILRNADPVWLHQNEMWEYLEVKLPGELCKGESAPAKIRKEPQISKEKMLNRKVDDDLPF